MTSPRAAAHVAALHVLDEDGCLAATIQNVSLPPLHVLERIEEQAELLLGAIGKDTDGEITAMLTLARLGIRIRSALE